MVVERFADELMRKARGNPAFANHAYIYYLVADKPKKALDAKMRYLDKTLALDKSTRTRDAFRDRMKQRIDRVSSILPGFLQRKFLNGPLGTPISLQDALQTLLENPSLPGLRSLGQKRSQKRIHRMKSDVAKTENMEVQTWLSDRHPPELASFALANEQSINRELERQLVYQSKSVKGYDAGAHDLAGTFQITSFLHALQLKIQQQNP